MGLPFVICSLAILTFQKQPIKKVHYYFLTHWEIRSSPEKIWDLLVKPEDWPEWWKGMDGSQLKGSETDSLGKTVRLTLKSFLPFTASIEYKMVELEYPSRIIAHAIGDFEGTGIWTLQEKDGVTIIEFKWDIVTTRTIVNLVSPVLGWFFRYNHRIIMKWGGKSLAKKLSTPIINK